MSEVHPVERCSCAGEGACRWVPPDRFCLSVDGVVHRATATYPGHADTACQRRLECRAFWISPPDERWMPEDVQRSERCRLCFTSSERPDSHGSRASPTMHPGGDGRWRQFHAAPTMTIVLKDEE